MFSFCSIFFSTWEKQQHTPEEAREGEIWWADGGAGLIQNTGSSGKPDFIGTGASKPVDMIAIEYGQFFHSETENKVINREWGQWEGIHDCSGEKAWRNGLVSIEEWIWKMPYDFWIAAGVHVRLIMTVILNWNQPAELCVLLQSSRWQVCRHSIDWGLNCSQFWSIQRNTVSARKQKAIQRSDYNV